MYESLVYTSYDVLQLSDIVFLFLLQHYTLGLLLPVSSRTGPTGFFIFTPTGICTT